MVIFAMSGTRMHREVRPRPGGSTSWMSVNATVNSTGDAATEQEATMRRLGELHRLLNSRKGSLHATYSKNTEANDEACDLNQKSIQALDALAQEYVDFEATMANVTSEQEPGDVLHAATLEVAEELETSPERSRPSTGRAGLLERCTDRGNQRIFRLLGGTRGHGRWTLQRLQGSLQPTCSL